MCFWQRKPQGFENTVQQKLGYRENFIVDIIYLLKMLKPLNLNATKLLILKIWYGI